MVIVKNNRGYYRLIYSLIPDINNFIIFRARIVNFIKKEAIGEAI